MDDELAIRFDILWNSCSWIQIDNQKRLISALDVLVVMKFAFFIWFTWFLWHIYLSRLETFGYIIQSHTASQHNYVIRMITLRRSSLNRPGGISSILVAFFGLSPPIAWTISIGVTRKLSAQVVVKTFLIVTFNWQCYLSDWKLSL